MRLLNRITFAALLALQSLIALGAAVNFPAGASAGTAHTENGRTWAFDGTTWVPQSGSPVAAAYLGVSAYNSATQSIPNGAETIVTFNSEVFDTSAFHDTGSNTSWFIIPSSGKWEGTATVSFATHGTGLRAAYWRLNGGSTYFPGPFQPTVSASFGAVLQPVFGPRDFVAGDRVELYVFQNSGGALNIGGTDEFSRTQVRIKKSDGIVGSGTASGNAFPAAPHSGQQFFRTDLGLECYYDGTRWLTKQLFTAHIGVSHGSINPVTATTTTTGIHMGTLDTAYSIWAERIVANTLVLTTNNGTHYWTVQYKTSTNAGSLTNLGASFTTAADTVDIGNTHVVTIGAALTAGSTTIEAGFTKTMSPGNIYPRAILIYRLIVT